MHHINQLVPKIHCGSYEPKVVLPAEHCRLPPKATPVVFWFFIPVTDAFLSSNIVTVSAKFSVLWMKTYYLCKGIAAKHNSSSQRWPVRKKFEHACSEAEQRWLEIFAIMSQFDCCVVCFNRAADNEITDILLM